MRPRVIVHNAVSLDGRLTGFAVNMGRYYSLASIWKEDATLCGSGTSVKPAGRGAAGPVPLVEVRRLL